MRKAEDYFLCVLDCRLVVAFSLPMIHPIFAAALLRAFFRLPNELEVLLCQWVDHHPRRRRPLPRLYPRRCQIGA